MIFIGLLTVLLLIELAAANAVESKVNPLVFIVVSTERDVIEMGPVIKLLQGHYAQHMQTAVLAVNVNQDSLRSTLSMFKISLNSTLGLSAQANYSPALFVSSAIEQMSAFYGGMGAGARAVVVHGDSDVSLAAAMAAYYSRIPVLHIHTGLGARDLASSFPNEFNRQAVSIIASLTMVATPASKELLVRAGADGDSVVVTGSTVLEAIAIARAAPLPSEHHEALQRVRVAINHSAGRPDGRCCVLVLPAEAELAIVSLSVQSLMDIYSNYVFIIVLPAGVSAQDIRVQPLASLTTVFLSGLGYPAAVRILGMSLLVLTSSADMAKEAAALSVPFLLIRFVS